MQAHQEASLVANKQPRKSTKRPRAAQACDRCRTKKYKCDEQYPCSQCKKNSLPCVYQGKYFERQSNHSASYVTQLEEKVEELEAQLLIAEAHAPDPRQLMKAPEPTAMEATTCSLRQTGSTPYVPIKPVGDAAYRLSIQSLNDEIKEVNHHNNGIEFYGSTSSAAIIGQVVQTRHPNSDEEPHHRSHRPADCSLISSLHNQSFSPSSCARENAAIKDENYYFDQAHVFMNGYFENIHFIHPFIDKEDFLARANDLWFNRSNTPQPSFVALYLSVLSFGALLRVWDEDKLAGMGRFEWSRKLFGEAQAHLNLSRFSNDLETTQCLCLMAKICQNELNPNSAYMYLGLAVRTSLSAGFNREDECSGSPRSCCISKTWWGLFSLEIELSFSVGRPDTLGTDEYHNRAVPDRDDSEYAIIPWMVDLAQIIRNVSTQIYHSHIRLQDRLSLALQIEIEIDRWLASLPERIKPDIGACTLSQNTLWDPKWAKTQRLVLGIRYYNVKILLLRPFLSLLTGKPQHLSNEIKETITRCLDAATKTIEMIHEMYQVHTFFRCWWYNTTYVMIATSTLLHAMSRLGMCTETEQFLRFVEMSVEILESMVESFVARKSAEIVRQHLQSFRASGTELVSRASETNEEPPVSIEIMAGQSLVEILDGTAGAESPYYSFEGIARLFADIGGFPMPGSD